MSIVKQVEAMLDEYKHSHAKRLEPEFLKALELNKELIERGWVKKREYDLADAVTSLPVSTEKRW